MVIQWFTHLTHSKKIPGSNPSCVEFACSSLHAWGSLQVPTPTVQWLMVTLNSLRCECVNGWWVGHLSRMFHTLCPMTFRVRDLMVKITHGCLVFSPKKDRKVLFFGPKSFSDDPLQQSMAAYLWAIWSFVSSLIRLEIGSWSHYYFRWKGARWSGLGLWLHSLWTPPFEDYQGMTNWEKGLRLDIKSSLVKLCV